MFIRVKKRTNPSGNTYEYAYQVANKYGKRRRMPKQKVKQYLGRVYRWEKESNNVIEIIEEQKNDFKENILQLLQNELKNYGFIEKEGFWNKENCYINVEQAMCIDKEGKDVCIAINDGFIHRATINDLIAFKPKESLERDIGKQLGNALISAGIRLKEAVFISLFHQIMQKSNNHQQSSTIPSNTKQ